MKSINLLSNRPKLYAAGLVLTLAIAVMSQRAKAAPVYNWASWVSTSATSASAGSVALSSSTGANTAIATPFPIQFDGVPFTPTNAPSAIVGNIGGESWSFELDFSTIFDTTGLIVGLGNFAHNLGWDYRLDAFDTTGSAIALSDLTQIGSFDHTWPPSEGSLKFNDDVILNTTTGLFEVSLVAGLNDNNSDILLLSLGANVGRLLISTVGLPGSGDGVNVLLASPVPLPPALPLMASGLGLLGLLGWRRRRKVTGHLNRHI